MFNFSDLYALGQTAGFSAADAMTAAAVALAESSGNPSAVGDNGNSIGLWQINLPAHPEFATWTLTDPATNAAAAYRVWAAAGGSFHPWTTFRNGTYAAFLPAGASVPSSSPIAPTPIPFPLTPSAPAAIDWQPWAWGAAAVFAFFLVRDVASNF